MKMFVYVFVPTVAFLHFANSQQPCRQFEMATDNLREVIIGQCEIYQQNINQPIFCTEGFRNCTEIWEAFSEAFKFQPRCNVDYHRLDRYFTLTDHSIPKDKSLFWENVYPFVIRYSNRGRRFYALSDTLPGYIANGPQWCSNESDTTGMSPPGTLCPGWEATPDCPQGAQRAFWIAASINYGSRASGEIFILLNATSDPIFSNNTYNAMYELPSLRENVVTKATVLLLNEHPIQGQTKCGDPTLDIISSKVKAKRIKYDCIENRRDLVETFCFDYPTADVCKILDTTSSSSFTASVLSTTLVSVFISSVIFID